LHSIAELVEGQGLKVAHDIEFYEAQLELLAYWEIGLKVHYLQIRYQKGFLDLEVGAIPQHKN
jgi:hypothetical protein